MSFSRRQSAADMANFKFSRRELPGKLLAIAGALLLPERRSEVWVAPTEVQPKFKIGDLIASDWVDEFDKDVVDFGEVLGTRYLPAGHSAFAANTWVYYINWTHSTCGADSCYPCYDGEPSRECDLRLVSAEEICKH
jgi:hypothetical protein